MNREELIACAQAACERWWDSFGGSANPEGEWEGLDDTERDYWCHVADGVLAAFYAEPAGESATPKGTE